MAITPRQKALLDFVDRFSEESGYAPSQAEIARHFGYRSLGTVQRLLVCLRRQGLLEGAPHARRGLSVKEAALCSPSRSLTLPLLGKVAAGRPIEAVENPRSIEVPTSLIRMTARPGDYFALEVEGNSMIDDGVWDGDLVVIRKQSSAERGQMVVALVDGCATLKRFHPEKERIELRPANPEFRPIVVLPHQSFQIEGIVAGMIRDCGRFSGGLNPC